MVAAPQSTQREMTNRRVARPATHRVQAAVPIALGDGGFDLCATTFFPEVIPLAPPAIGTRSAIDEIRDRRSAIGEMRAIGESAHDRGTGRRTTTAQLPPESRSHSGWLTGWTEIVDRPAKSRIDHEIVDRPPSSRDRRNRRSTHDGHGAANAVYRMHRERDRGAASARRNIIGAAQGTTTESYERQAHHNR